MKRNLLYVQRTHALRNPDFRQIKTLAEASSTLERVNTKMPDVLVAEVQNPECEVFALRVGMHDNLPFVLTEHLGRFHNAMEAKLIQCFVDSDEPNDTRDVSLFITQTRMKGWSLLKEVDNG